MLQGRATPYGQDEITAVFMLNSDTFLYTLYPRVGLDPTQLGKRKTCLVELAKDCLVDAVFLDNELSVKIRN
jgi:hypothetical protein